MPGELGWKGDRGSSDMAIASELKIETNYSKYLKTGHSKPIKISLDSFSYNML